MNLPKAGKTSATENGSALPPNPTLNSDYIVSREERILVTGSSGFIGAKVAETLFEHGFTNVRCFVRNSSRLQRLKQALSRFRTGANAELFIGDLLSRDDCRKAAEGVSIIYHLAAGIEKSFAGAFMNSALTTRNLIEAFLERGQPKRFVNVSSFSVYSNLKLKPGDCLDETCELEEKPQERFDPYCFGKLKQEELIKQYRAERGLPCVIVRPGAVFGPGKREISGRIGTKAPGFFIHIGGSNDLPLTFVDNCAEAIVLAGLKPGVDGETFNIVDDEVVTSNEFLAAYKRSRGSFFCVRVPYSLAYALSWAWEKYAVWSAGQLPPVFNRRRCSAEWKAQRFSNEKIRQQIGWRPRVPMHQAMEAFRRQFRSDKNGDFSDALTTQKDTTPSASVLGPQRLN
jgi:nucleoside-diphosphate-sugar epimerase